MTRKAVTSYDIRGTDTEKLRDLRQGLDSVIYEMIVVFGQKPDSVLALCQFAADDAEDEQRTISESSA